MDAWLRAVSAAAVSAADPTKKSASAQVTVINHVLASVQPANVTLVPPGRAGFSSLSFGNNQPKRDLAGAGLGLRGGRRLRNR